HHLEANLGLVVQLGGDDDTDKDGIKNADDQCPSDPEDKDNFEDSDGCPDKDNDKDGILDTDDRCPNEPEDKDGVKDDDGCPDLDRDGDGIEDEKDKCPTEPEDKDGFEDNDGCPDLDNDGDGIPDKGDKCPLKPEDKDGFEDNDGCPDTDNDGDGIVDAKDKCPDQAENINQIEDEDGCPEQAVIVTRQKIEIKQKVFFETDKAVIRSVSFDLLDQVAATLKEFSNITRVEIQGHTDNRGSAEYNQDLSERRADAVRAYLIDKGDIEPDRLVTRGFGSSQPIEGDTEEASWEKSRRVEFVILSQAGYGETSPGEASPSDADDNPDSETKSD
ncbi:MAG: OmpA family protein, partial [Pseudomonadota bacterium]|nr:OmpA family protein [Pseudomonadota bacterium]